MKASSLLLAAAITIPLVSLFFSCHAGSLPGPGSDYKPSDTLHCVPEDSAYSFEALDLQWNDAEDGCGNTVSSVIRAHSLVPVVYRDSARCIVESGKWIDEYTKDTLYSGIDVAVDHLVPVPDAYASGGWAWTHKQWLIFYNDTANLAITTPKNVADKAESSLWQWQPWTHGVPTEYNYRWTTIKGLYRLRASVVENDYLRAFGDTLALVDYDCKEP